MDKTDRIGLVFSGGGGKGSYQAGVWKALCEQGWDKAICALSGASVGALNAAAIAADPDPCSLQKLWLSIDPLQFLDFELPLAGDGIFSREGLSNMIISHLALPRISKSSRMVYVNTSEQISEQEHRARYFLLNEQPVPKILPILLASSAIPVAYPSVPIDGSNHQDGGLTDNLPISPLYERESLRRFILVNISSSTVTPPPEAFPDAEFLEILPSRSIGDFFDGTMDFTPEGARFRLELGYHDALRTLRAYESGELADPDFRRKMQIESNSDYQHIRTEMLTQKYTRQTEEKLRELDDVLKKYNIDL